jgi:hypothetical protein
MIDAHTTGADGVGGGVEVGVDEPHAVTATLSRMTGTDRGRQTM